MSHFQEINQATDIDSNMTQILEVSDIKLW